VTHLSHSRATAHVIRQPFPVGASASPGEGTWRPVPTLVPCREIEPLFDIFRPNMKWFDLFRRDAASPSIDDLRRHGNLLMAERKSLEALAVFEQLISAFPESPHGYDGAARALSGLGRYEEVLSRFEEVAMRLRYPRLLLTVADAARVLEARGQRLLKAKVVVLYEEVVKVKEDAVARWWLGQLYRQLNEDEKAIASFRRAWELDPRNANAYKAMLNLLREQGRSNEIDEAKRLWKIRNR